MTNHDGDQLGSWLNLGPDRGPTSTLDDALGRVASIRQRPAWIVALNGDTIAARPVDRRLLLGAAAVVALVALVAGGRISSGRLGLIPAPSPAGRPSPTDQSTTPPTVPPDVIVFTETKALVQGEEDCTNRHCLRSWVAIANADGTGQRRLFPDAPPTQSVVAVSPDGSRMIVQGMEAGEGQAQNPTYYLTDLNGSEPVRIDAHCAQPCVADSLGSFAFSPDGLRLAFVRWVNDAPGGFLDGASSVVAIMDLASGDVTELESTFVSNPDLGRPCFTGCGDGDTEDPRWSTDGRQLLFSRSRIGVANQPHRILDTALFVVDGDGANLRQLVPSELFARDAHWSPDGTSIVFTSAIETLTVDDFGMLEDWHQLNDIYNVSPDGTDLKRLTSFTAGLTLGKPGDVGATLPMWTRDGRIAFTRRLEDLPEADQPPAWEIWTMDADGQNGARLEPANAATLTGVGCVECAYPFPDRWNYPAIGFWRPNP